MKRDYPVFIRKLKEYEEARAQIEEGPVNPLSSIRPNASFQLSKLKFRLKFNLINLILSNLAIKY